MCGHCNMCTGCCRAKFKKMGTGYDYMKRRVVNFKLDMCCIYFPVRFGLLFTGYLNTILALISLVGLSDDSFKPLLMEIEEALMPDTAKKPIPILAYAAELCFSIILLCALYRRDTMLMRVYQRYCLAAFVASIMIYSVVVATVGILQDMELVISIIFQLYIILLVRSMIVELKLEKRNLQLPTLVMTSTNNVKEVKVEHDVEEIKIESVENKSEGNDEKDKLETVEENSKEESTSEEDDKERK